MPSDLTRLPHELDEGAKTCRAVIETPRGRRSKYDYDPSTGLFRIKTLLPEGQSFPTDFGFVPSTLCDDGDPLDVMVLADEPGTTGTLIEVRLLGVLEVEEVEHGKSERNDRLLAAALQTHLYGKINTIAELDPSFLDNLKAFWTLKAKLEGKELRILGVRKGKRAVRLVVRAARRARRRG